MITQEQIAKQLGISRQLVTLALNGHPRVSERSRKRILATANRMGYSPNPYARALMGGHTGLIALWIPDQISLHYVRVTRELNRLLKHEQYELIISEVGTDGGKQIISNVPMDGVLIVDAFDLAKTRLKATVGQTAPAIYMGAERYDEKSDYVYVDLFEPSVNAMNHLIRNGYRRILHMTNVTRSQLNTAPRSKAYLKTLQKAGLKPEVLYYPLDEQQRPCVRQLIRDYVQKTGCPDAIFCHSDDAVMGVYRGLCDLKLRVPEDVAVVGCDGIDEMEYLPTPMTTIVQPVSEMCQIAWRFLQQRIDTPEAPAQHAELKAKLVTRESTFKRERKRV